MPTPALKGLERGYHDIKYAADNGLTLERHVVEQWQFLADRARPALRGVDLEGKSPDEIAGAYHDKQIAAHALAQRVLQQRIGALEDGNYEPPSRPAREAAGRGTSLEQLTSEDRQFERSVAVAVEELSHLFDGNVREEEAEAWWASEAGRAAAQDTVAAGPVRQGYAVTGEAATATNKAAWRDGSALVPTVSQAGLCRVMAEAGRRHHRRLSAQADQACRAARSAGWASKDANEAARRAVHTAGAAAGTPSPPTPAAGKSGGRTLAAPRCWRGTASILPTASRRKQFPRPSPRPRRRQGPSSGGCSAPLRTSSNHPASPALTSPARPGAMRSPSGFPRTAATSAPASR